MALETLKQVTQIGAFDVYSDNEIADGKWSDVDPKYCVCVHHGDNTISFRIQNGPIKENGVNGCQVDTMIAATKIILQGLNDKFPCIENEGAISHLGMALTCLEERTAHREARGVEGTSKI